MKHYDLIVVGGGLSGTAAAIAAAREGLEVLLVEKNQHLGGAASNSLINPFMKYCIQRDDGLARLNNGFFGKIVDTMREMGGLNEADKLNVVFNGEYLKFILENSCVENNVNVLYGTMVTGAECVGGVINKISIFNRDGAGEVTADFYIDCSGDANLAYYAGVPFMLGRAEDNLCQPMTLCFWISNVDTEKYKKEKPLINPKYKELQSKGLITNSRENVLIFNNIAPGILHFNTTRVVGLNPTDAADVTKAQFIARRQVFEMYDFLKNNFECFKNSVLLLSAPEIGVRESRKIEGEYLYTQEDIINFTKFEDSIACGCYEIDIHNPCGTGTHLIYLDRTKYYTIPYRSLIPKGVKNMLVAGRCISSTHEAQSAYRIMPIICNIGEAAGCAVACAAKSRTSLRCINMGDLHAMLEKYGVKYN